MKVSELKNYLETKLNQITEIMNDKKLSEAQKEEWVETIAKEIATKTNEYIQRKKYLHTF